VASRATPSAHAFDLRADHDTRLGFAAGLGARLDSGAVTLNYVRSRIAVNFARPPPIAGRSYPAQPALIPTK
jgi:hypothetical protein